MLLGLKDHGDRFETIWFAGAESVTVSVDKPEMHASTESHLQHLRENLNATLEASRVYFQENKSRQNVEYIDDLADPQIILSKDRYAVFWWSDKGEANGECIIGIDFDLTNHVPIGMTLGD